MFCNGVDEEGGNWVGGGGGGLVGGGDGGVECCCGGEGEDFVGYGRGVEDEHWDIGL